MAEIYNAVDWHKPTGKLYMPALEKCAVNSTNRKHESPTFYQIQGYLAFFQPLLKEPVLVVSHREVMPIIEETIETKLMPDSSFGSLPRGNQPRVSFSRQDFAYPVFLRGGSHSEESSNFAEFLDEAIGSNQGFRLCQAFELMYGVGWTVNRFGNAVINNFGYKGKICPDKTSEDLNISEECFKTIASSLNFDKVVPSLKHIKDYLIFRSMDDVHLHPIYSGTYTQKLARKKKRYINSLKKSS